jgi:imidazolonepropionase-like amidohydrolase
MRRSIAALLAVLTGARLLAQPAAAPPPLLIRDVTLIDGNGGPPRPGVDILLKDGRVQSIGSGAAQALLTIDGRGLFAMPGLTDSHVHLSGMPWAERADQLQRVLRGGVTMVYDVASDLRNTSDLSRAALTGEIDAPTIYYAALFAGPAFFTDPRVVSTSRGYRPGDAPWNRAIGPDTDLVRAIAEARGAGATSIKLYAALDGAAVRRIGDEARRQQVRLIAHATVFPAKPGDLVAAGVKMLAHTAYLVWEGAPPTPDFPKRARGDFAGVPADGPVMARLLQSMKDNDVALNPTLWIFAEGPAQDDMSALRTPWMNAVTKRAQDMGVVIAAGVDSLLTPGDPLPMIHKELEILVTGAKLTPLQAITAATRGAAHAIGVDDARGTLTAGKIADLLIVDADPATDIRNTRRIRFVIKDGRIVHAQAAGR